MEVLLVLILKWPSNSINKATQRLNGRTESKEPTLLQPTSQLCYQGFTFPNQRPAQHSDLLPGSFPLHAWPSELTVYCTARDVKWTRAWFSARGRPWCWCSHTHTHIHSVSTPGAPRRQCLHQIDKASRSDRPSHEWHFVGSVFSPLLLSLSASKIRSLLNLSQYDLS